MHCGGPVAAFGNQRLQQKDCPLATELVDSCSQTEGRLLLVVMHSSSVDKAPSREGALDLALAQIISCGPFYGSRCHMVPKVQFSPA